MSVDIGHNSAGTLNVAYHSASHVLLPLIHAKIQHCVESRAYDCITPVMILSVTALARV